LRVPTTRVLGYSAVIAAGVIVAGCGSSTDVPIAKAPVPPVDPNPAQPKLPNKNILKNASPKGLNPGKSS
jgi:hypothetical protein